METRFARRRALDRTLASLAVGRGLFLTAALLVAAPIAAQSPDTRIREILASPSFTQATEFIASDQERFVRELIALT
jgi:hypothetical protein